MYPTHGFGSFCASAKSEGESDGTLGTERVVNVALTIDDEDEFVERLVSGLTAHPAYYAHMAPLNQSGPRRRRPVAARPGRAAELARRIHRGEWVVDLRRRRAFAAEHVAGTIGIELADPFSTYLGWLVPWGSRLTLLAATPESVAAAQRQLVRIGLDQLGGATTGELDEAATSLAPSAHRCHRFRSGSPLRWNAARRSWWSTSGDETSGGQGT